MNTKIFINEHAYVYHQTCLMRILLINFENLNYLPQARVAFKHLSFSKAVPVVVLAKNLLDKVYFKILPGVNFLLKVQTNFLSTDSCFETLSSSYVPSSFGLPFFVDQNSLTILVLSYSRHIIESIPFIDYPNPSPTQT